MNGLFCRSDCRDILRHLLRVASPGLFGAVAQLNRHCSEVAKSIADEKRLSCVMLHCWTDSVGRREERIYRHNGMRHGAFRRYFADGRLYESSEFYDGERHGRCIFVDNDGSSSEVDYVHGVRHGQVIKRHPNGNVWKKFSYINGLCQGVCRSWYNNGQLELECTLIDGMLDGEGRIWHPDGRLKSITIYKNGIPQAKRSF